MVTKEFITCMINLIIADFEKALPAEKSTAKKIEFIKTMSKLLEDLEEIENSKK